MTRKQKNLIKILTAVLLLGIIVFVVMSSERMFGENSGATKAPSPTCTSTPTNTPTPVPTSTPTPTATNTPTPFPTNTPTPTEIIYPFTDVEAIKYMNYAGRMAKLEMADGRLIMGDFGYYTFVDHYGAEHTYRMADYVSIPGEEKLEEGNWFFMGALETPNYVYAQYDYWGNSEYTVFIRVSRTGRNGIMLDYMPYDEMENYRCFTASNEYIFYVDEKDGRYEIIEAGVDGSDARSLVSFEAGMRPTGLWCTETELVFFLNDGKKTSLMAVELRTEKLRTIRASLYASDYLYLSNRFAITGIVNNHLCYVDLTNGGEHYLRLVNGNDLYWGEPVCSDTVVYLQFFFWEEENKTQALIIDLNSGSARQTVTFDDELAYLCGCDKDILYAEKDGSYVLYQIENFSP